MVSPFTRFLRMFLLSSLLVFVVFAGGDKLRYQLSKGAKAKYTITDDTKSRQQMMGQDMADTSWSYFALSFVGEDAGKNGELVMTVKVDSNLQKIYSSTMKDTSRVMKEINNKKMLLVMTPVGKTLKTEQIDQIPQAQAMMRGTNPVDMLKRLFIELPEKEVGAGDTWKNTTPDTALMRGMKIITKPDITFKIAGSEKSGGYDCLKITFEGTSSQYGTSSQQGTELVIDGTVKTKGTLYFAPKDSMMVNVEQMSTSDMNFSGTGEHMFTITLSITNTNKVTLSK